VALDSTPALQKPKNPQTNKYKNTKIQTEAWSWRLMPIILSTWEAEITEIMVPGQPGLKSL
jgi:hypothetical protein